jgi:hypothetical protein
MPYVPAIEQEFSQGPSPELVVEHRSIAGFLRIAPRRFHLDEMIRFGKKVGDAAESMQLAYLTTTDSHLGVVRIFPVPLMRRVYDVMAAQFHWQPFLEPLEDEETVKRETLRANEKAKRHLQAAVEHANNPRVTEAMVVVLDWMEAETRRLASDDPSSAPEAPAPLRSI